MPQTSILYSNLVRKQTTTTPNSNASPLFGGLFTPKSENNKEQQQVIKDFRGNAIIQHGFKK